MKSREAIEIIKAEIHSYSPNTSSEFAERVAEGIYKRICFEGWLPPETIAKEYVRLDMVVEGKYTLDACDKQPMSRLFQLGNYSMKAGVTCEDCEFYTHRKPITVAELIER